MNTESPHVSDAQKHERAVQGLLNLTHTIAFVLTHAEAPRTPASIARAVSGLALKEGYTPAQVAALMLEDLDDLTLLLEAVQCELEARPAREESDG